MDIEKKVLVVEDDVFLKKILVQNIAANNIKVESFNNGRDALQAIQNSPPDLLVLDLFLPEMTGFEVLEALRKDPKLEKLRVLVVTNTDQKADREKVNNMGAEFIVKALVTPMEIAKRIKEILGIKEETTQSPDLIIPVEEMEKMHNENPEKSGQ